MRWRIIVSLVSLAVIFFSVRYAIAQERLRSPKYLHDLYQKTNQEFFDGQLPEVVLEVRDLSKQNAEGLTYYKERDGVVIGLVIALYPYWNTSKDEAVDTMRHEACHVATWDAGEADAHGPLFQECMKRFKVAK